MRFSRPLPLAPVYQSGVASFRRIFRSSEGALIVLSVGIGILAGLLMIFQRAIAHGVQTLIYGLGGPSLSGAASINPISLLALPVAGFILALGSRAAARRWRTPIDVVEANALHGGAIPLRDTLIVCAQTIVSNGAGASVGLEAAYAQAGGGIASQLGRWLRLRRADWSVPVPARRLEQPSVRHSRVPSTRSRSLSAPTRPRPSPPSPLRAFPPPCSFALRGWRPT